MSKISLCLITGNCEEYIDRCLTSFRAIADEIVVVRAIGSAKPDRTLDIAREKFGAITAEYENKPGHRHWHHVDDFAAARQKSFDLATGDYCFWCDTDDILESGAEIIRQLADKAAYPCYLFPYRIFGHGLNLPRERMIDKKAGRWIFPVHESFKFNVEPVRACQDDRVVVTHLPHGDKTGSNPRNLRILRSIPTKQMTAGLWYHLHTELAIAGDIPGSVAAAKKALACPLAAPEKYEIFINLAQTAKEPEQKAALLHQAYAAAPERREALLMLTNNSLNAGRDVEALAYARQMFATPVPEKTVWNERIECYGWLGADLYSQALRANDLAAEAESLRRRSLEQNGGARIALIHATRGRPRQASECRKLWLDLAARPGQVEHIFCIDADDKESAPLRRMHNVVVEPLGCVNAWNMGAFFTTAPVLVQVSDDFSPPPYWDNLILERLGDLNKPSVLAVSDGFRTDQLLCMAICTRAYFNLDYFLFHPRFTGVYSDNLFTDQAYKRGAVIEARDLSFPHAHFLKTGKQPDRTYLEQNSSERYRQGQEIYRDLTERPEADWTSIHGWFNYWPFYRDIAQGLKDGDTIAEIGTWFGRSIVYLAQELKRAGKKVKILAVDTFKGEVSQPEHLAIVAKHGGSIRAAFEANIARCGVADMIEIIEGDSAESAAKVPDASLAFAYLDAAHDYDSVRKDLAAWIPKVRPGGMLAGHDAQHEPVMRAVKEACPEHMTIGPVWIRK